MARYAVSVSHVAGMCWLTTFLDREAPLDTVVFPIANQIAPPCNPLFDGAATIEQLAAGVELLTVNLLRKEFQVTRVTSIEKRCNIAIVHGKYLRMYYEFRRNEPPSYLYPDSMGITTDLYGRWQEDIFSVIPTEESIPLVHALIVAKGKRFVYMASELQTMYPQYFR